MLASIRTLKTKGNQKMSCEKRSQAPLPLNIDLKIIQHDKIFSLLYPKNKQKKSITQQSASNLKLSTFLDSSVNPLMNSSKTEDDFNTLINFLSPHFSFLFYHGNRTTLLVSENPLWNLRSKQENRLLTS